MAVKTVKRLLMANLSLNGDLNNDYFLRAILQLRNTPDPDCGISPSEVAFGHPLLHAFLFVNRLEKFLNRYIQRTSQETLRAQEDVPRLRSGRNDGTLSKATCRLCLLSCGDRVFIQNQKGNHPRKWDKLGTVVEVSKNDQYVIKILGSGCLTTGNRRFFRLIQAPDKSTIQVPLGPTSYHPDHAFQALSAPIGNFRPHVS